jgi:alkylation response protein AidB-like acyl-CoA dehydrogenase
VIGFEPSDEQQLIIETVRQFASEVLRPVARESDEASKLPDAALAAAHELGLVANALPESAGGGGARSAVTACLIAEELGWADLSLAVAILSPGLVALPVLDFGTDAQRKELLSRYAGGSLRPGALAIVEPTFRRDAFRPATRALRVAGGFELSGDKCLVPWIDGDDLVLVSASCAGRAELFLVPRNAAGLTATRERNLGLQALPTVELALRGVRVRESARLGGDAGADLALVIARGRVALAALGVGVARAAFELARDYAKQRETFGAPIATRQSIAFKLADMAIEIDGARLLTWEAAWRLDQGLSALREATLAVQQVRRVALEVSDGAVQVFGGHGYTREYLPELLLRNARGLAVCEALALV